MWNDDNNTNKRNSPWNLVTVLLASRGAAERAPLLGSCRLFVQLWELKSSGESCSSWIYNPLSCSHSNKSSQASFFFWSSNEKPCAVAKQGQHSGASQSLVGCIREKPLTSRICGPDECRGAVDVGPVGDTVLSYQAAAAAVCSF